MRRVLIIAPDFAPSSMPPATRARFFASHLAEFGWQPVVVAAEPGFYEGTIDDDNQRLLPPDLEVHRTRAVSTRFARRLGFGDIGIRSLPHTWREICRLCKKDDIDLVFVPVPPYVPMILGRLAHIRFGVPYVIDYIDPWVIEDYWRLPREKRPPKWPLAYGMSRVLEPFALKRAAALVGVSSGTGDLVLSRYARGKNLAFTEIPYGGEPADFEFVRRHPREQRIFDAGDGLIHLCYAGVFIPPMIPTLRALFAGIKTGLSRNPALFERVRLHFVGTSYATGPRAQPQIVPIAETEGLSKYVDEHTSRVPYLDAVQILTDAHALLLLGFDAPHYTASKVFPCVLSRRPLLAIVHEDSSVVSILEDTQAGTVVTFGASRSVSECADEIGMHLEQLLGLPREATPPTKWDRFESFTSRAMTRRLAQVFDDAVSALRPSADPAHS